MVRTVTLWHVQGNTVWVHDGEIVMSSTRCEPGPAGPEECEVQEFDPEDFTVSGLFDTAHELAQIAGGSQGFVLFDEEYGYPSFISYDDPAMMDEEWGWAVISFKITQ